MLKRFRLSVRIIALGVGLMVAFSIVTALLYPQLKQSFYAEKQAKTRNLVEAAAGIITHFSQLEAEGALSRDAAQAEAKRLIAAMHYDGNNYFWINDLHPTMVMHPVKPELDGKDLTANADPNGKHLFVEMVKVAKAEGEGFVDYYWPKPGQEEPAAKISYVKLEPRWGWIVGSGIYVDNVEAQLRSVFLVVFGTLGVLSLIGIATFVGLSRSITGPLERSIADLKAGSGRIHTTIDQITHGAVRLAHESSQQAQSLMHTTGALEHMSSTTKQNAEHSTEANTLMRETNRIAVEASGSMQKLTQAMQEVSRSSEETSKVVKTIDEIAFQTNILALNAAVEAARAGEAGAGFAVVADEVRALAQRAAQAAQNTGKLIDDTVTKIQAGSNLVTETSTSFDGVTGRSERLQHLVDQINTATREQAEGIERINATIADIDRITQQNAHNAEDSAHAAEGLKAEAAGMNALTAELTQIVHGSGEGPQVRGETMPPPPKPTPKAKAPKKVRSASVAYSG